MLKSGLMSNSSSFNKLTVEVRVKMSWEGEREKKRKNKNFQTSHANAQHQSSDRLTHQEIWHEHVEDNNGQGDDR